MFLNIFKKKEKVPDIRTFKKLLYLNKIKKKLSGLSPSKIEKANRLIKEYSEMNNKEEIIFKLFIKIDNIYSIEMILDRLETNISEISEVSTKTTNKFYNEYDLHIKYFFNTNKIIVENHLRIKSIRNNFKITQKFYLETKKKIDLKTKKRDKLVELKNYFLQIYEFSKDLPKEILKVEDYKQILKNMEYLEKIEKGLLYCFKKKNVDYFKEEILKRKFKGFLDKIIFRFERLIYSLIYNLFENFNKSIFLKIYSLIKKFREKKCQSKNLENFNFGNIIKKILKNEINKIFENENSENSQSNLITFFETFLKNFGKEIIENENFKLEEIIIYTLQILKKKPEFENDNNYLLKSIIKLQNSFKKNISLKNLDVIFNQFYSDYLYRVSTKFFYDIILNFEINDFFNYQINQDIYDVFPFLKNSEDFEKFFQNFENRNNSELIYSNNYFKLVFDRFFRLEIFFDKLQKNFNNLKKPIFLEIFFLILFQVIDFNDLKENLTIDQNLLQDCTYFKHKLTLLGSYQNLNYKNFSNLEKLVEEKINSSIEINEKNQLLNEIKNIKKKFVEKFKSEKNNYIQKKNKIYFLSSFFQNLTLLDLLKNYLNMTKKVKFTFKIDYEKNINIFALTFLDNFINSKELQKYIDITIKNIDVNTDFELYYNIILKKLIKDYKENFNFIEFFGKNLLFKEFLDILEFVFFNKFLQNIIFVFFNENFYCKKSVLEENLKEKLKISLEELNLNSQNKRIFKDFLNNLDFENSNFIFKENFENLSKNLNLNLIIKYMLKIEQKYQTDNLKKILKTSDLYKIMNI